MLSTTMKTLPQTQNSISSITGRVDNSCHWIQAAAIDQFEISWCGAHPTWIGNDKVSFLPNFRAPDIFLKPHDLLLEGDEIHYFHEFPLGYAGREDMGKGKE
jgi:hypothetical protein